MPTDEERRKIAAKLRKAMASNCYPLCIAVGVFGFECGEHGKCGDCNTAMFNRIADLIEPEPINGETSDGYHTFNELYHHRALLFSVVVRNYPELCWKSKKHHTGDMYEGMFIVGIDTPDGQASYHYDIEPYWDMFDCEELEFAPEWDGHTPAQAIERIGKLTRREPEERTCTFDTEDGGCSNCGERALSHDCYCPNCGARVKED